VTGNPAVVKQHLNATDDYINYAFFESNEDKT
jgi:hypothetical protein